MRIVLTTFLLVFPCAYFSYGQGKVDIDQKVTLFGTLKYELFYGAPGFGESPGTDAREPTYILHLNCPIFFRDTSLAETSYSKIKTIQVRFMPGDKMVGEHLRKLKDQKVEIICTLYGAITGHHHAPALTD